MQNKIAHAQMTDRAAGFCEMHATIKNPLLLAYILHKLLTMQFDFFLWFPLGFNYFFERKIQKKSSPLEEFVVRQKILK